MSLVRGAETLFFSVFPDSQFSIVGFGRQGPEVQILSPRPTFLSRDLLFLKFSELFQSLEAPVTSFRRASHKLADALTRGAAH